MSLMLHRALVALLSLSHPMSGLSKPGTITGLQLSTATPAVGGEVKITIQGDGTCGLLSLSLGDGRPTSLSSVDLPHTVTHVYGQPGSHTVQVSGAGPSHQCTGGAAVPITVKTYAELLCGQVECGPLVDAISNKPDLIDQIDAGKLGDVELSCLKTPKITGILLGSLITPGGPVVLSGCGFIGNPELRLVGQFPGGYVTLIPDPGGWAYGHFWGHIPAGIIGAPDQDAFLQIVTKYGSSQHWNVYFTADRQITYLRTNDVVADCGNKEITKDDCPDGCDVTLCGSHALWVPGDIWGTDHVAATLANGWTYYKTGFRWNAKGLTPGEASDAFVGSETQPQVKVSWNVGGWSSLNYRVKVKIAGPVGVPYK
jgi:hypothetical protein